MKKFYIFAMALVVSAFAIAADPAYVEIELTGATGGSSSVYLYEDNGYTNAYESGADVEKFMSFSNSKSVLLNGLVDSYKCEDVVTNNLDGQVLGFATNQVDANYTLKFIDLEGRELKLYARVTKTQTVLTNNGTYNFSVEASQVGQVQINDRFVINYEAPAYIIMNGDFADPGNAWAYTSNFTDNGTNFSLDLDLAADTWYHFQLEEGYSPAIIAADGSSFDRDNNSHNLPVDGWHSALLLHADVAGTYTFTWYDLTDNLTITFPAVAPANTVTTNAYGFCSFASSEDVEFLGGLKAYKGDFNPATFELDLVEVGTKVPANTGVILWNSAETAETFYYNVGVDASAADVTGNDFVGAVAATPVAGISADAIYCLHGNELMKYVGTEDIPAGKAYLPVTVSGPNPAPKHIVMRFNNTTAVDNVEAGAEAVKFVEDGQVLIRRGNEVYNLQGQIVK